MSLTPGDQQFESWPLHCLGVRGEAEGQTGSEMKLQETEVMKSRRSMFKPAEAGTGDGPLPCGKEVVESFESSWSELVGSFCGRLLRSG